MKSYSVHLAVSRVIVCYAILPYRLPEFQVDSSIGNSITVDVGLSFGFELFRPLFMLNCIQNLFWEFFVLLVSSSSVHTLTRLNLGSQLIPHCND